MKGRIRSGLDVLRGPVNIIDGESGESKEVWMALPGIFGTKEYQDDEAEYLVPIDRKLLDSLGATALPGALLTAEMDSEAKTVSELDIADIRLEADLMSHDDWWSMVGDLVERMHAQDVIITPDPDVPELTNGN